MGRLRVEVGRGRCPRCRLTAAWLPGALRQWHLFLLSPVYLVMESFTSDSTNKPDRGYTYVPILSPILTWIFGRWLKANGWESRNGHLEKDET